MGCVSLTDCIAAAGIESFLCWARAAVEPLMRARLIISDCLSMWVRSVLLEGLECKIQFRENPPRN